jgi:hypothetical protein
MNSPSGEISMKKIICLVFIMAMVFVGSAWAAGIYVMPGKVGTKISSLPYTISAPGYYYFNGNLSIDLSAGTAITISASNVTLDLMGFSLINTHAAGFAANGIVINGLAGVEIRNGTVVNFTECVNAASTSVANHRIFNMRCTNGGDGIYLKGQNHLVQNCNTSNNYYGIYLDSGTISNCVACNNTNTGIRLNGAGSVLGSIANNNTSHNFYFASANITVNRNSAAGLATNYYISGSATPVVISALNAGQP